MGNIRIYSSLSSGKVSFEGSRVREKNIGSLEAIAHPTESDRIVIKSTVFYKRDSTTEFREFFKRLKIDRIEDKDGQVLTEAPLFYDRDQVLNYVNNEFTKPTISEYFEYSPSSDRLVAKKDIEVDKNGFFLGGKHKMASGNSNIYFEDLDNKANAYPVFGEVLDQSLAANQVAGEGTTKPKSRIFGDFQSVPLGGSPVNDTAIGYDGNNFFPFNISGVGITTRVAEVVLPTQQLKYEIIVNGISVYVQYLEHNGLAINEDLTWYFEQPLDIENGTTLRATIYKVSTVNNQEQNDGILLVCEGDDVATRYQTNVLSRFFEDEDIALKSDVDALLSGSTYKGSYNGSTNTPSLPTGTDVLGDFYRVTASGNGYNTGDILVFNGTSYDHIAEENATQSDIKNSGLKIYDIYVKAGYAGAVQDGSVLYPFASIETALATTIDGDSIYLEGSFEVAGEVILPQDQSLYFYGSDDACISFTSYNEGNGSLLYFNGLDNTKELKFRNIEFKNAGGYGLYLKKASKVTIEDCKFRNNGWNGTELNTILPSTSTALLGYDSTDTELQAFYAGVNASNGGAMRIEEATQVLITGNTVTNNLRGIRVQDCGINGAGVISRNQSTQNIESGIYIAAGSLGGCQNITTTMNVSAYNANNGLLVIGGINNKFSQNEVNGNWNAGFCAWGSANTTLRDSGLYDNNRSEYNGIGNTGDAKASIQINEAYNLLGTSISLNPAFRFIAEILDTQVHYTGLGSNTGKIGFLITSDVGNLAYDEKNIIKVDDVGFIGQDYAIDFSEVNLNNLYVSLGDNSYMNIGEKAVRPPLSGDYFELPFSNHTTKIKYADVYLDLVGNVFIDEGVGGNRLNPYKVNELEAVAYGSDIKVILKGSDKIQFIVPVAGCSIDGVLVNSVLNQALIQLNNVFTNSVGFASDDTYVSGFILSGDDLTLSLNDGTSYTVDVTTLGVDENKFVDSGAINGTDLELTMNDSSVVVVDMQNMINGSSLSATNNNWYVSYGVNANLAVTSGVVDSTAIGDGSLLRSQQPFYFGKPLTQGSEFKFNMNTSQQARFGIWDGVEEPQGYSTGATFVSNYGTCFAFVNGTSKFVDSSNTDISTYHAGGYVASSNEPMSIRFSGDGHLTLFSLLGGTEAIIGKTTIPLVETSFNLQFGSWNAGMFPNGILSTSDWTIVHDYDNSENGVIDGIEDHTVIRSNISIEKGEKIMLMLDYSGRANYFGTSYDGGVSSGLDTAEYQLGNLLQYATNEALNFEFTGTSDWDVNTNATYYFDNGAGIVGYRKGSSSGTIGAGLPQGMFSLRFNNDGKLTIYSEDNNEKVATAKVDPVIGSSVNLYYGVREDGSFVSIPSISKQSINGGTQPNIDAAPVVVNQTTTVTEGDSLSFQIVSSDNIVNQFFESDAPNWMFLDQSTGILSGTAPAYVGSSADTIVVNCKAGNAIGGSIDFTVTVTVAQAASYTNSNSLQFGNSTTVLQGNASNLTSLQKSSIGSNAWSVSLWVYPSSNSTQESIFYYGGTNPANNGAITLEQFSGGNLSLAYGKTGRAIVAFGVNNFPLNQWNHILVTHDGSNTGTGWNQSYGSGAGDYIDSSTITGGINGNQPFHNPYELAQGEEFNWTHSTGYDFMIGVYGGAATNVSGNTGMISSNWTVGFKYDYSENAIVFGDSSGTNQTVDYTVSGTTEYSLRYTNSNVLELYDTSGVSDVLIAQSTATLTGASQTISIAANQNFTFPVFTGAVINDIYAGFKMFVNGSSSVTQYQNIGEGYGGSILPQEFKLGKYLNSTPRHFNGKINQIAIWDSDQSANVSTIYNSGVTQDLSLLSEAPVNYYEIENSVTSIPDLSGSAALTGYNFSNSDLVNDTP